MYDYKVSIVMAVYNVEPFLRESIESVIDQNIGFENIQLILVNDGSKDNSAAICNEYAEKYPDNIIAIHKENGGVSSARNAGLAHVSGQYVNFLDSDDKLSSNAVRLVCEFFREHHRETDLVTIPLVYFDAQDGAHPLNKKFDQGTRVIDLRRDWQYSQLSSSSAFIKAGCLANLRFDTALAYAEDAQLVQMILAEKQTMGVVAEATYHYRARSTGEASAVQSSGKTTAWYFPYLAHFPEYLIRHCLDTLGEVPLFIQNTLMYDLQWRFRQDHIPGEMVSELEADAYRSRLFALLNQIDDTVILSQNRLSVEQKLFLMRRKHPDTAFDTIYHFGRKQQMLMCNQQAMCDFSEFQLCVHFITLKQDRLDLEFTCMVPDTAFGSPKAYICRNGIRILAEESHYDEVLYSVDIPIALRKGFRVSIPLDEDPCSLEFLLDYGVFQVSPTNLVMGKHCPITYKLSKSYFNSGDYLLFPTKKGMRVEKSCKQAVRMAEKMLLLELLQKKEKAARHALLARVLVAILRPLVPRNIWLITDKADRADDNGEAFFLHCVRNKKQAGCYPVFAIGKNTDDYRRLKKYGPVIPYMSWRHKFCHLLAKHTISAYSHDEITSPFLSRSHYYCDLLQHNKIVFLQHGIIKDDLSKGLNKNHKNYSLFVTSTYPEYDSILENNYGYTEKQVIMTGLPRYDRLYNSNQKKITVMPTWRRNLFGSYDPNTSRWSLLPGFEESAFYRFYSSLLNSETLREAAGKYGYTIQFLIHPTLFPYLDRFHLNPGVTVLGSDAVYRNVFAESSLILTDYSSVAFDMAYLRKPVLYAHFDSNHYAEGYFDYERDGFGEVEYDLEATIDRIIEYMATGCQLKEKYRTRINSFFAFNDKNNSQRVYEKIMELDAND